MNVIKKEVNVIKINSLDRKCIFTGEKQRKSKLVRFVVGPDKIVVPDILERLPGRGFWLKASRHVVFDACKENVFSRSARTSVTVPEDLIDLVERLLRQHCLEVFGLACRAGQMVGGYEKVRSVLSVENSGVLVFASDGAEDGKNKISRLVSDNPIINCFSGSELGAAVGMGRLVHAVITPGGFAKKLLVETSRLLGFQENDSICKLR